MGKIRLIICTTGSLALLGCSSTIMSWKANSYYDEFTNAKSCRVENGTEGERTFARQFTGNYFSQYFYAENYNGEIRAGIRSEPALPIGGDIQIKVDEKLYTLTSQNAPLDVKIETPSIANKDYFSKSYAETMNSVNDTVQKMASPYRAYTGIKAKTLLRDIVNSKNEIKFRTVGINTAVSTTGSFKSDDKFIKALNDCDISY